MAFKPHCRKCLHWHWLHEPCPFDGDFKRNVFPELKDKRINELSIEQIRDAREDWIRANCEYVDDSYHRHVAFLLSRIDELRKQLASLAGG